MGIDKLSGQNRGERWPADRSGGGGRCDPNAIGIGSKEAKSGSADHVSLGVEGVVDDGVGGEEPLSWALGFELLLLSLSPSSSTARHSHIRLTPIFTTISFRCQRPVGLGLDRRRF
jgi:hypothetical protein